MREFCPLKSMIRPNTIAPKSLAQLSDYTLVELIYQGARTVVYRAFQTEQQRPVVIKALRHDYPSFSELVQFRNQYVIARNLNLSFAYDDHTVDDMIITKYMINSMIMIINILSNKTMVTI